MIVLMAVLLRRSSLRARGAGARARRRPTAGHEHHTRRRAAQLAGTPDARVDAWSDVAHNFRGDWQMLWKEITLGFLIAGFVAQLGDDFFNGLFIRTRRRRCASWRT